MQPDCSTQPAGTVIAAPVAVLLAAGARVCALAPDEQQKALGYVHRVDRDRSIAAHWLKRRVLAGMTGRAAKALVFNVLPDGKPMLAGGPQFNLSHSGGWIVLAVHPDTPVGVDVELHSPTTPWPDILPVIRGEGDADIPPLYLWTAKEAALKEEGQGFTHDPRRIVVQATNLAAFKIKTPEGCRSGSWRPLDPLHLAAASGVRDFKWHICEDTAGIDALCGRRQQDL